MPRVLSKVPRNVDRLWPGSNTSARMEYLRVESYNHKPEWPSGTPSNPYSMVYSRADLSGNWPRSFNGADPRVDIPNITAVHSLNTQPWDGRLYAGVYAAFMSAARDGSAEWGMNLLQWRQSYKMLVHYLQLAADAHSKLKRTYKRGIGWLNNHPNESLKSVGHRRRRALARFRRNASDRRIKAELRILDEASGALLAYRYGVAPLMSDIAATAHVLSEESDQSVQLRKTAFTGWGGQWGKITYMGDSSMDFKGTERCTLRGNCAVSNPNLLLANRLGIINPQTWIWDAIPWSFVVDWWFPIGTFLSNFTASVGLSFTDVSVTRTRDGSGTLSKWNMSETSYQGKPQHDQLHFVAKRKERSAGSLPLPFSVPYGTGLGISRAQNAFALIMQFFSRGFK